MATLADRFKGNTPGAFYVDTTCTDCDLCRSLAPAFFVRDDESGQTFVQRQPTSAEEIAEAEEARDLCPSESIGSDGEAA